MSNEPENSSPETPVNTPAPAPAPPAGKSEKKLITGIFALLLGGLGVHKFYLGYTKEGIIQLILGLACGIGSIIGIIEGIIYLTKTDDEFDQTYVHGTKPWF
ncbi:MAG: TM2 domain-containing protein [Verrucomicrobiales bacterium]